MWMESNEKGNLATYNDPKIYNAVDNILNIVHQNLLIIIE